MAPIKRFAKYSEDLQKVIAFLESGESKDVKKALTIVKRVEKNAAKYAGTSDEEVKKPRKLNNYMLFVIENRDKVVAEMPAGTKATEITKKLGAMWQKEKDTWQPKKGTSQVAAKKKSTPKKAAAAPKGKKAKLSDQFDDDEDNE